MAGLRSRVRGLGLWPRHAAFVWSMVAGAVALGAMLLIHPRYAVAIAADATFATYLAVVAVEFPRLTAEFLEKRPDDADAPVGAIFAIIVLVVAVALGSLFLTLNDGDAFDSVEIALSVISVMLGWFTVHTMAALHYAHEFYLDDASSKGYGDVVGGLDFPGTDRPDGVAFLYFSYVIGMTAQVADVAVSSNRMRRLVMIHGIFAFFFNTVIVAATVNVVVAVAGS